MRARACTLVLAFGMLWALALPGTALAVTWTTVKAPAKFVAYAKHAHKHGMQAWYPKRVPRGFKRSSMTFGVAGDSRPYCNIVFKKGSTKVYFGQGTVVGVDGEMPERDGTCTWGTDVAEIYEHGSLFGNIAWFGASSDFACLSGGLSLATEKSVASTMRKVQ